MLFNNNEQKGIEKNQQSFYYIKDDKSGFPVITIGYKDKDPSRSLQAKIAPTQGSNLFSFKIDEYEFIYYDPEMPLADYVTGTPVLFPFPNRIEDAMWTWKGKTYLQKKNGIPIQMHSLVYDESWEYIEPELGKDGVFFSTYLNINKEYPIYKGYPFEFMLILTYKLTKEGLYVTYKVENRDNKEMPFGFALHPYFTKLSGENGTFISVPALYRYEIRSDVDKVFLNKYKGGFQLVPNILPSGRLKCVYTSGKNLIYPVPVGCVDLDDVYTGFLPGKNSYIDYATLKLRLNLLYTPDFTHTVAYTPKNKPYFCIEPQTCSTDAINLYAKGIDFPHIIILPQGYSYSGTINFEPEYY
ncbi:MULTISPECIES: aldose 1-epimerase [unclassified Clostridium]|uniref:aldose 1-epimerase n=1 Tax=unclassified Clostridium TaxID=2614128 RepID=UPI00029809F6|nr:MULTISPECIES: aldose 1-epimerase [unclassified Clostridium]EKQ58098.1 MAG: galactose mutarotase-like enzyme [Clostridium sp. Maddingley MBC34-26]